MGIIVQKFGGTSLRNPLGFQFLLSNVKKIKNQKKDLVIVVSSIGREGDPYATDTLINELEKIHINIDPMKKDLIMSCGEVISSAIMAHLLEANGIPAIPLTGFQAGILTDNHFNGAEVLDIDTKVILKNLQAGKVVVVAGFQGITSDMQITTLGRGGSDITAVTLGGFLGAERIYIFTDVEGVALVDPRIVPYTKYIETISYSNMYNLAFHGAGIIHPKAVLVAEKYNIPVHIRGIFENRKGTIISEYEETRENEIIGISINKEVSLKKSMEKVSIFFTEKNNLEIKRDIESFLSNYGFQIFDLLWQENMVQFIVDPSNTISIVESLYKFLFK